VPLATHGVAQGYPSGYSRHLTTKSRLAVSSSLRRLRSASSSPVSLGGTFSTIIMAGSRQPLTQVYFL
jgi:hypothetical protein